MNQVHLDRARERAELARERATLLQARATIAAIRADRAERAYAAALARDALRAPSVGTGKTAGITLAARAASA